MTVTIIGLLASLTLGALQATRQSALEHNTKALIAKLDQVIRRRCDSYETRRVPVWTRGLQPQEAAQRRLDALRDLMRMELPDRWTDVYNSSDADFPGETPYQYAWGSIPRPALSQVYLSKYKANQPSPEFGPAECLYMIVAVGSPGAMENFSPKEIGDADGDGWPEFHDAWGQPIMFLRWAPGFTAESDIQSEEKDPETGAYRQPDPFDPRDLSSGYHLIPLIYSAGRDKKYDIEVNKKYAYEGDPYASGAGMPVDEDGDGPNHFDNIHNHSQQ